MIPHFLVGSDAIEGDRVTITGDDARHIKTVLRLKKGDRITVAAGGSRRFRCRIESVGEIVEASIVEKLEGAYQQVPPITLYQALSKAKKFDDVVRMTCELGVVKIVPVVTERCDVKLDEDNTTKKLERWRKIAHSAAKQSQAASVTKIDEPITVDQVETVSGLNLLFWEEETRPLKQVMDDSPLPSSISLLVGPEGGFTPEEINALQDKGFINASLGPKILRTETAPVAAVAAVIYHFSN